MTRFLQSDASAILTGLSLISFGAMLATWAIIIGGY